METTKICPNCRKTLPPDVPLGLCPECLIKSGFPTGADPVAAVSERFVPPPVEEIAALFPQLEILGLIGKGGMGAVYKARQPALDRFVALKVLPPAVADDPGFAERFNREARALARLNHPNIVTVHDFGKAGSLHYLVMEFVDGTNLREVERAGKLLPEQALAIVPQICDALQFAHNEGIVHRDIKPENLLLDKRGRLKITDFGIAKIIGIATPEKGALTGAKDVVGTPHYMAPEQIEKPQTVDHRADIFSLGVVFYEMLTGELPLGKFEPPSRKVRVDVQLDEVVLRALEKEPARRYQQVSEVKTRLETISSAGTGASVPPSISQETFAEAAIARDYSLNISHCLNRAWMLLANDFWPIIGVTLLIVFLVKASSIVAFIIATPLMGGLWLYFLQKVRGQQPVVSTAFSGFNTGFLQLFLAGLVTKALLALGLLCLIVPGIYLAVAWAFTTILVIDKQMDFWPAMSLSRQVISKHWWKFLWFFIVMWFIHVVGLMACVVGVVISTPLCMAALAYAYEDIFAPCAPGGVTPRAARPTSPAQAFAAPGMAPASVSPKTGLSAGAQIALAAAAVVVLVSLMGLLAAIAIPNFVNARERAQRQNVIRLNQEGWALLNSGKIIPAETKFHEAIHVNRNNAESWNGLGWAYFNSGQWRNAIQNFQQALRIDPSHPAALNGLGQVFLSQGQYDKAEEFLLKAAPDAPAAQYGLARLYLLEGKFDEAKEWAQKAVDSGNGDETAQKMLDAAKSGNVSDDLRRLLEPHPDKKTKSKKQPVEQADPPQPPGAPEPPVKPNPPATIAPQAGLEFGMSAIG